MEMSDNQLAVLAGQGDANAFQRLFERYQHPVYNFVYRMVDNAEDASDIVQNAFIRIYSVLGEKEIDNFSAYLYRTARNLSYDEMRRRQRFADVDHEILAPEDPGIYADPQRALMLSEQIDSVRRAVANLGENQRAALILKELQDFNYDEMAEVLDSNRNAVGALLSRARIRLREELRMAQIQTNQIPVGCEAVISLLSPYIDGELSESEAARVDTHVADCSFCAAALEEMREASRSFRILIPVVAPADIAQAMTGHINEVAAHGTQSTPGGDYSPQTQGAGDTLSAGAKGSGTERSVFSRVLGNRVLWGAVAGILVFGMSALLMAERSGNEESAAPSAVTTPSNARTTSNTRSTYTATVPAASTQAVEVEEQPAPVITPEPSAPDTVAQPEAPFGIVGGEFAPATVYLGESLRFSVSVEGQATSVTVSLVSVSSGLSSGSFSLSKGSSGASGQVWTGQGTAQSPGRYDVYASATGTGGSQEGLSLGTLTVSP